MAKPENQPKYSELDSTAHYSQLWTVYEALARGYQFEINLDDYSRFIQESGLLSIKYQPGYAETSAYRLDLSGLENELTRLSPYTLDEMVFCSLIEERFGGRHTTSDSADESPAYTELKGAQLFEMILRLRQPYIKIFDPETHRGDLAKKSTLQFPHQAGFRVAQLAPMTSFDERTCRFAFNIRGKNDQEFRWMPENDLTRVALNLKRVWIPSADDVKPRRNAGGRSFPV